MSNGYDTQPRFMWDVGAGENEMKLITTMLLKQKQRIQTGPGGETYYGRVPGGVTFGWRAPDLYYKSPLDSAGDKIYKAWYPGQFLGQITGKVSDVTGLGKTFEKVKIYAIGIGLVALLGVGVYVGVKVGGVGKPQVVVVQQPATEVKKAPITYEKMPKEVQEGIRAMSEMVVLTAQKNWDEAPESREPLLGLVADYMDYTPDKKYLRMAWDDLPDKMQKDVAKSLAHAMGERRVRQK